MNLVDKLLKADVKKADELETGIFQSLKLAKILGEKEAIEVKIQEIKSRRVNDIISYQLDSKGRVDYGKNFDSKLMLCVEGVIEPNLRDKELQAHFGCDNAKDLCEKLFGSEITDLSDAITKISGFGAEAEDEEIKNS